MGQCFQKSRIVHYGKWRSKRTDEILLSVKIYPVLHPYARIGLTQGGGR